METGDGAQDFTQRAGPPSSQACGMAAGLPQAQTRQDVVWREHHLPSRKLSPASSCSHQLLTNFCFP